MFKIYLIAGLVAVILAAAALLQLLSRRGRLRETGPINVVGGLAISQEVLKDQRWRPDFILSAIQDGVIMVGKDNLIHLLNPAASDITGWPPKDALGLDFHNVLTLTDPKGEPIPPEAHPFSQVLNTGQVCRTSDYSLTARSGKPVPISLIASPVTSSHEGVDSVVGVFRDISAEKAEEAARSDFISTASHEMRTPLAAIEGYLSLSLNPKTAQIDTNARNYLEKASVSTKHLGELFRDLLTSTKAEDGRIASYPTVFEVGEILQQAAEAAKFPAQTKGLELKYAVSADPAAADRARRPLYYAYADPNRLREVFQNLIDNAIKYTMSGQIEVRLTGDAGVAQIQIKDTGAGIPAEDIPHLFQKFYRVDNSTTRTVGGTGLGLFICRKIIELYNGRIWVESQLGQGSTFFINLPRLTSQQALEMQQKQASTISPSEPTI